MLEENEAKALEEVRIQLTTHESKEILPNNESA